MRLGRALSVLSVAAAFAACSSWPGEIRATLRYNEAQHRLTVDAVPAGGASAHAGLRVNDEIVAIDGLPVAAMTDAEIAQRVRGEVGTRLRFRVVRDGGEREITVERAPIEAPPASSGSTP